MSNRKAATKPPQHSLHQKRPTLQTIFFLNMNTFFIMKDTDHLDSFAALVDTCALFVFDDTEPASPNPNGQPPILQWQSPSRHYHPLPPPPTPISNSVERVTYSTDATRKTVQRKLLYKTTDCVSYKPGIGCRYGTKCRFRHPHERARPRPSYDTIEAAVNNLNIRIGYK